MSNKILTAKQAAKALGVNDSRIRQLILVGRLPAQKFGPVWMIKEKDLSKVADRKPGRPGWLKKGG
jgi:excisionase family DNA binding protein